MVTRRSFLAAASAACVLPRLDTLAAVIPSGGRAFHVSLQGDDKNDGSPARMLRTISAAADRAYPGDVITVHAGTYRERVAPPRGGSSAKAPIVYQAAPGEKVVITGAELQKGWVRDKGDVWVVRIPNARFGNFNPYSDLIHGDWFDPKGRQHHTGAVYLNGDWLIEAANLEDLYAAPGTVPLWFGRVDEVATTLWAQFPGVDPNAQQVEINVRQTVFYPATPGINFITVRGFHLQQAATPWAPPTAEQIGIIGTHWSKGWVIENNRVCYATCSGIALGKYGDQYDNTSANTADGYVQTIKRAAARGWSKENIGHHIVRQNVISHCEQAGVVGSLGAVFSTITKNDIHDIHVRQLFAGWEMAGIKIHAAIDTEISHNRVHHCSRGLWLDWMAQGTYVHGNLFHDNTGDDGLVEVDHGPFTFANNIFLSKATSQIIVSQGGVYAHNLFCGDISVKQYDARMTPYMEPHSCRIAGYHDNPSGDMRFYNNIFATGSDLSAYDVSRLPMHLGGNVFLKGSTPCVKEMNPLIKRDFDLAPHLLERGDVPTISFNADVAWVPARRRPPVETGMLGKAVIPKLPFESPNGGMLKIDTDYAGKKRDMTNPFPGPFEIKKSGVTLIPVPPAGL